MGTSSPVNVTGNVTGGRDVAPTRLPNRPGFTHSGFPLETPGWGASNPAMPGPSGPRIPPTPDLPMGPRIPPANNFPDLPIGPKGPFTGPRPMVPPQMMNPELALKQARRDERLNS